MANAKYRNPDTWDCIDHDRVNGQVEYQMESIRSGQKEEAEAAVGHGISELKTQILQEIDKEITALETKLMVKMNEDC